MKGTILAAVLAVILGCGSAIAQDATCASRAVGKDGKPMSGAAKTSFVKKCTSG